MQYGFMYSMVQKTHKYAQGNKAKQNTKHRYSNCSTGSGGNFKFKDQLRRPITHIYLGN